MDEVLILRAAGRPLRIGIRIGTPVGGALTKAAQVDGGAMVGTEVALGIITVMLVMALELERVS